MPDRRTPTESRYQRIYAVVRRIPSGRVATYGQIAALAGLPGHARQVGYALYALPDDQPTAGEPAVPWHRVVNARGEVSVRSPNGAPGREGYQAHLLREEGVVFDRHGRIDLARFRWEDEPPTRGMLLP
jgi:methylated-DNA-protein-cysteine methyltransferase-like protein